MDAKFDFSELDEFSKKHLSKIAKNTPKAIDKLMKREGKKLGTKTIATAKKATKKKTSNYIKSIKTGKPYDYHGNEKAIRVYSYAPHAHLIEDGHRLVKGGKLSKGGKEIGFVKGKKVFENARKNFEGTFYSDIEKFIDDVLSKGL